MRSEKAKRTSHEIIQKIDRKECDLDAQIATRVMGYCRVPNATWWRKDGRDYTLVPRYSTEIESAMEVVEKMRERGEYVVITAGGKQNWTVWFQDNDEAFHHESLPRAICLAAIAVFRKVPESRTSEALKWPKTK